MKLDGSDWPAISVEANCATCGRLIFAEGIRPAVLMNYASVAWYWRDQVLSHLERCPGSGQSGRSTSGAPAEGSTGPAAENDVERPDSNKSGRSSVDCPCGEGRNPLHALLHTKGSTDGNA